jgi:hypothetical protein
MYKPVIVKWPGKATSMYSVLSQSSNTAKIPLRWSDFEKWIW